MKSTNNIMVFLILCLTTVTAQRTVLDQLTGIGRVLRAILNNALERDSRTSLYARALQASQRAQSVIDDATPFPCPMRGRKSAEKPVSVHALRPGDIDVIGAIGDSLTAGFGALATNLFNLLREYRGVSFSIGGEKTWRQYLTVPNILKEFNPNLIGYSLASTSSIDRRSQFNVAESGAVSSESVYMAKVLVKRITSDSRVNITSDWKMINICIGANDFCAVTCYEKNVFDSVVKHKRDLIKVLRILRDSLPRTFVNIISPPNVALLKHIDNLPDHCQVTQRFSCPCFIGERFSALEPVLMDVIARWKQVDMDISNYKEFDRDDFAVVVQPVFQDLILPAKKDGSTDQTFFSQDCFHFSQKGHAGVAVAIWNDMLSPIGRKQTNIFSERLLCPTKRTPYIFTNRTSRNSTFVSMKNL